MRKSANECETLEELHELRLSRYQDRVNDGDNIEQALVEIYEKAAHFVYELLQNADDAYAKRVCFDLTEEQLIFWHDGTKDFDIKSIIDITGVSRRGKEGDKTKIGKFGMGFKSVFKITNTPHIYNRLNNFKIEHLTVPSRIEPDDLDKYTTKFVLPFNNEKFPPEKAFQVIDLELHELDSKILMFLQSIESLTIHAGNYHKEIKLDKRERGGYTILNDVDAGYQYYKFKDKDSGVSLVFRKKDNEFVPFENAYISSFLPTRVLSELPFLIDAPFALTATRESINFDNETNRELLQSINDLFRQVLVQFRDMGVINQEFLNEMLPIDAEKSERSTIYRSLRDGLPMILQNTELLPAISGRYLTANEGVLYASREMTKLVEKYKKEWFNIGNGKLRTYLKNILGVGEVSLWKFTTYLVNEGIIENRDKDKDWQIRFCRLCVNSDEFSAWNSNIEGFKSLKILKTRAGNFASAYDNGEEQLFRKSPGLPPERIIHPLYTSEKGQTEETIEDLNKFLNKLGIRTCSPTQYMETFLLKDWHELDYDESKKVFFKISDLYNSANMMERLTIAEKAAEYHLLPVGHGKVWRSGSGLMRGSEDQKMIFTDAEFLDEEFWTDVVEKNEKGEERQVGSRSFCEGMGVTDGLPIVLHQNFSGNLGDVSEKMLDDLKLRMDYEIWSYRQWYEVDGLDKALREIDSRAKSEALVRLLTAIPKDLTAEMIFLHRPRSSAELASKNIPARYLWGLDAQAWIFDSEKRLRPSDITESRFVELYNLKGTEPFLDAIPFQTTALDNLSKSERKAYDLIRKIEAKGLSTDDMEKVMDRCIRELGLSEDEKPEEKAEEEAVRELDLPDVNDVEIVHMAKMSDDENAKFEDNELLGVDISGVNKHTDNVGDKNKSDIAKKLNDAKYSFELCMPRTVRKMIGDFGENIVYKDLKQKYENLGCKVKWYGNNNKGYDFTVTQNDRVIEFVEAKTDLGCKKKVKLTTAEWNKAVVEGDKYSIYVVQKQGERYPIKIIDNPYQQFIDKKIKLDVEGIEYK